MIKMITKVIIIMKKLDINQALMLLIESKNKNRKLSLILKVRKFLLKMKVLEIIF